MLRQHTRAWYANQVEILGATPFNRVQSGIDIRSGSSGKFDHPQILLSGTKTGQAKLQRRMSALQREAMIAISVEWSRIGAKEAAPETSCFLGLLEHTG